MSDGTACAYLPTSCILHLVSQNRTKFNKGKNAPALLENKNVYMDGKFMKDLGIILNWIAEQMITTKQPKTFEIKNSN